MRPIVGRVAAPIPVDFGAGSRHRAGLAVTCHNAAVGFDLVIRGATVVTPGHREAADIGIAGGRIAQLAADSDADIALWDPGHRRTIDGARMQSLSGYSVYDGWQVQAGRDSSSAAASSCSLTARSRPAPATVNGFAVTERSECYLPVPGAAYS